MGNLQKILVRAKRQVFSEMIGNNPSIFHGQGYDFIELREYMPGDDIRHIDWNITAKMQQPFVKIFREERELNIVLVSLLGGSVYFGSKKFKQESIAEVAALLGYSTLKNGDLLSSYIFTDKLISSTKPSKKIHQVQKITEEILEFNPIGQKVSMEVVAKTLLSRLKKKSLVLIIGDFFEIPDFRVLAKKHEVISIVVRDILEETPPVMGLSSLIDPQSQHAIDGDFNPTTIEEYNKQVQLHDKKLFNTFQKDQIRFRKIYTDKNVGVELRRLFEGR
ncbi:MAG: DUF58 domain-containing protein [Sulfurimonadaceae bacterium]|jgi:uncharacterized protein (DUF58 family)|nr:DUF58 domain-containing protein [Sulfurimonadaceae bacterium]